MSRADNFDTGDGRWDEDLNEKATPDNQGSQIDKATEGKKGLQKEHDDEYLGGGA